MNNQIVAAQEKNMLVTSFHPELTNDLRLHQYFINMCK
ncbi:glutamine amidotransferase subunit PdxT [Streptococcus infantis SK1302]|uniref:Glutamine amidotransferase subunit PdxT n=1 Tax=Streptococcus infantis SK1302 TaxID=871237 RepID=A0ABN0B7K7_9STRE|nr:glutamine amidotransferase subunit PdxT [Streptococcus infantis SK1302]